jgi:hypothetical protein
MVGEDKAAELKGVIEEAFEDIPYPGDHNITAETPGDIEEKEVADVLRGRHWREVSVDYIAEHPFLWSSLAFLKPSALRFYLPAFMIATIDDYIKADFLIIALLAQLTPGFHKPYSKVADDFASLSAEQSHAVRLYLEYMLEEHPEYKDYLGQGPVDDSLLLALERYWGDK